MTQSQPYILASWPAPKHVHALTTLKHSPVFDNFSMTPFRGDVNHNHQNVKSLKKLASIPGEILWLRQVHEAKLVEMPNTTQPEADGAWTAKPNQACAVLTGDCLPIVLCDKAGSVIAALHGGWRSLAKGIIEKGVTQLQAKTNRPIMAWLGPAIGAAVYQVGPEVRDAFVAKDNKLDIAFTEDTRKDKHYLMDMVAIAKHKLNEVGVEDIFGGQYCTFSQNDQFFSHRRNQDIGRMATLIWMQK